MKIKHGCVTGCGRGSGREEIGDQQNPNGSTPGRQRGSDSPAGQATDVGVVRQVQRECGTAGLIAFY